MVKLYLSKIMGIEEKQEFSIKGTGYKFRINENRLEFYSNMNDDWLDSPLEVNDLLKYFDDVEIIQ